MCHILYKYEYIISVFQNIFILIYIPHVHLRYNDIFIMFNYL